MFLTLLYINTGTTEVPRKGLNNHKERDLRSTTLDDPPLLQFPEAFCCYGNINSSIMRLLEIAPKQEMMKFGKLRPFVSIRSVQPAEIGRPQHCADFLFRRNEIRPLLPQEFRSHNSLVLWAIKVSDSFRDPVNSSNMLARGAPSLHALSCVMP